LAEDVTAIAFLATDVQLSLALRALFVPGFLFWLAGLTGLAIGLKFLFARFVSQLDSTLRMDAILGVRGLSADGT
jgi:hypothetical protein